MVLYNRSIQDIVKSDVVLISYDFLLMKLPIFSEIQWRYVIADDGYKMKNASGKVPQVMKQFLTYEHITLSMEREVEIVKPKNEAHIFNLLHFIDPENYDSSKYQEFQLHFTHDESENAEKLKKIVEPYLLCRSSDIIAEQSKPKQEKIIITEPSSIQKTLYVNSIKELTPIFMKPITDQADDQQKRIKVLSVCTISVTNIEEKS